MAATSASTVVDRIDVYSASSVADLEAASELTRRATNAIDSALAHPANASRDTGDLSNAATQSAPVSTELKLVDDRFTHIVNLPAQVHRWVCRAERWEFEVKHIVNLPAQVHRWPPAPMLHPVQEWEGHVVDIGTTDFIARLVDLTAGSSYEEEEATIPLDELSDIDIAKMRIGSLFRWVIGYERSPAGTKKRVSQIVLRDLPAVTESDRRSGRAWARKMMQALTP